MPSQRPLVTGTTIARSALDDLVPIRLLTAVAETGSIGSAAERAGMTQQAASARLRSLERELGVTVLTRTTRGSELTADGRLIVEWAAELLAAAERLEAGIDTLVQRGRRRLRIAASLTVAEYLVPRWLPRLSETALELVAQNSDGVLASVRSGDVELGFVETPDLPDDLEHRRFASDELVLVVAPQHPWATAPSISPELLIATPIIARESGSGTRRAVDDALAHAARLAGVEPAVVAEPIAVLPTTSAIRSAVEAGLGPAMLSILAVRDDLGSGRLVRVRVEGLQATRPLSFVWRRGHEPGPAASRLLEVIAEH